MTTMEDRPGAANTEATNEPNQLGTADDNYAPVGYSAAAMAYREAGWQGVLPLKSGAKKPHLAGFTGNNGVWPSDSQIQLWTECFPRGNLALRLPGDVIGIDVDAYKPEGAQTIFDATERLGELPATWYSSSRDDGRSGIYLYRVPEGRQWKSVLGAGVEVVKRTHRIVLAWPSIHPEGRRYRWHGRDGIPRPDALPELPGSWITELTDTDVRPAAPRPATGVPLFDVSAAMTAGPPRGKVLKRLHRAIRDLDGTDRHVTTGGHVLALLAYGKQGIWGVRHALDELRRAYVHAVGPSREGGYAQAEGDFDRLVSGGGRLL